MLSGIFVFDMDGTLLSKRTVDVLCSVFNLNERLKSIDEISSTLPAYRVEEMVAKLFSGKNVSEMLSAFDSIPLNDGAEDFIGEVKAQGFLTAIATDSYTFLAIKLASKLKIDFVYGLDVEVRNNIFTGKIISDYKCQEIPSCRRYYVCKLWFIRELKKKYMCPIVSIGDSESDFCMSIGADYSIAVNPKSKKLKEICKLNVKSFKDLLKLDINTFISGQ
ncbi:MAG: HAD-IB family phosphatase [Nitrososphaeria archaeon]